MSEAETFDDYVRGRIGALTRTAYLLTGDHAQADDLVQTALARCFLKWKRIDDPDAYVRRAMVNAQRSWWRSKPWRETPLDTLPEPPPAADFASPLVQRQLLLVALQRLPAQQRAVVVLSYLDDLSQEQVAATLGVSVGTVKRQRARALARLRAELPAEERAPTGLRPAEGVQ